MPGTRGSVRGGKSSKVVRKAPSKTTKSKTTTRTAASKEASARKAAGEPAHERENLHPYDPDGIPSKPVEPDKMGTGRQFVPGASKPHRLGGRR